ncbi:MAG TPA: pantoate--beta-alanine ligase [Candidatus Krumholzibacteria bacterium]|nr:pantoate--beta-alanine ligase [Candidatus Krumholzibacteria bacterium]
MRVYHDIESLRQHLAAERPGRRVALVPTMGALHRGHGSCVAVARGVSDALVVASIFVNPAQFAPGEDFEKYPRTLDADIEHLRRWSCDVLFAPAAGVMYPEPQRVWVDPGALAEPLDGRFRPGHFRGVATVVAKLFHIVGPDVAVFGQKDAQQALVIRALVRQLALDIELRLARTVREADGLAVSSRNAYLSPSERVQAGTLFKSLEAARRSLESGERDPRRVEAVAVDTLRGAGVIDYAELRSATDLSALDTAKGRVILALAAHVGTTRLIDNMVFDVHDDGVHTDVMLY